MPLDGHDAAFVGQLGTRDPLVITTRVDSIGITPVIVHFKKSFEKVWVVDDPYGVQWTILVHDVRVRLYHQMGLNGPKTTISHINFFCKNREFMLKPHSYHYLFYCERFHLFVSIFTRRMGCSCFSSLESNFPPINFQESHLQDPRDLLGA